MSISMPTSRQRSLRTWMFWAVPVLLLLTPLATNAYTQFIVNGMLISIRVTLGFTLVIGNLGQLAFANTAFFGIGAYASAILSAGPVAVWCRSFDSIMISKGDELWAQEERMNSARMQCELR